MGFDSTQVIAWLDKYKRGTLSVEEDRLLKDWVAQSPENKSFFDEVDQDEQYFNHLQNDTLSRFRVFEEVRRRTGDLGQTPIEYSIPTVQAPSTPTKTFSLPRVARWVAAASILVILIGGYSYFYSPFRRSLKDDIGRRVPAKGDILPGGNKAILRLANGTKITLDSARDGVLATIGNIQIHKLQNGQVAYQPVDGKGAKTIGKASVPLAYDCLSTPRGGQYQLTLPDGSKVWLNSESTLSYPVAFVGSQRKVRLSGEGYFEVVTDAAHPFHVETAKGDIEVLGTSFNVSSYPDEKAEMTTLLTGKIKVNTTAKTVLLRPGEQVFQTASSMAIRHPNLQTVTAWRRGFFNFSEADVQTVMLQLSRWYDVDFRFEGAPTTEKIDGLISRDLRLSEALTVLRNLHINVTLVDRTIIIRP